jgi:hypothetical protein
MHTDVMRLAGADLDRRDDRHRYWPDDVQG